VVGRTLQAVTGTWSIRPESFGYQWYAGQTAIKGATGATYQPTADEAGKHLHVVVTAQAAGYTDLPATSAVTDRVVFGRVAFDKPTIRGLAYVGRTVRAHTTGLNPSTATAGYRWYRDSTPIRGARAASYVVQAADLGHRLHVVVTMKASHWITRQRRSLSVTRVTTMPHLRVRTSTHSGRVLLHLAVSSPGLSTSNGVARVWRGSTLVGSVTVADGHGTRLLAAMRRGSHQLTIVYRAGPDEAVARRTITVTAP
jgi:hypothetical protein